MLRTTNAREMYRGGGSSRGDPPPPIASKRSNFVNSAAGNILIFAPLRAAGRTRGGRCVADDQERQVRGYDPPAGLIGQTAKSLEAEYVMLRGMIDTRRL